MYIIDIELKDRWALIFYFFTGCQEWESVYIDKPSTWYNLNLSFKQRQIFASH